MMLPISLEHITVCLITSDNDLGRSFFPKVILRTSIQEATNHYKHRVVCSAKSSRKDIYQLDVRKVDES